MRWTLVVSQDEMFQREAMARLATDRQAVGATGEQSAVNLVHAIAVEQILVDALDEVGKHFLGLLHRLPANRFPNVVVIDPTRRDVRYRTTSTIAGALGVSEKQPA